MNFLTIITRQESELSRLLERLFPGLTERISPEEISNYCLGHSSVIAVLGGTEKTPLTLEAQARNALECEIESGKRVFCEYLQSVGEVYAGEPVSTRFRRLSAVNPALGLDRGELLEEQCNQFLSPYCSRATGEPLLLYQEAVSAHSRAELPAEAASDVKCWALWEERPNLLLAAFQLCNPGRARFAPFGRWDRVFAWLLEWLGCKTPSGFALERPYHLETGERSFEELVGTAASAATRWFCRANILRANGTRGVTEGFSTEVSPDGIQKRAASVRTDCAGEASLLFLADYLRTGNLISLERSDHLERFCFEQMQICEGPFAGMLRWTDTAWAVCYQDDAARALIPSLLKFMLLGRTEFLPRCAAALDFLQRVTGPDGLRPPRIDLITMDPTRASLIHSEKFPSAHYNAYYSASLLLGGKIMGRADFLATGIRGLESLMAVYPHTVREQSETQELCRLVFPLACLVWATGSSRHRKWLAQVTKDLQKMKHPSGAYLEWDSDYSAACSQNLGGECSLLARNGDPVIDLLYSDNWLPLGFWAAWRVTGEERYYALWKNICKFLSRIQLRSDNPLIDGAWARGFDVEFMEVYGMPNDVGWGPWAIESGWTVAEIAAGMALGLTEHNPFASGDAAR